MDVIKHGKSVEEACERGRPGRAPWTQDGEIFKWCFFPIEEGGAMEFSKLSS